MPGALRAERPRPRARAPQERSGDSSASPRRAWGGPDTAPAAVTGLRTRIDALLAGWGEAAAAAEVHAIELASGTYDEEAWEAFFSRAAPLVADRDIDEADWAVRLDTFPAGSDKAAANAWLRVRDTGATDEETTLRLDAWLLARLKGGPARERLREASIATLLAGAPTASRLTRLEESLGRGAAR